MESTTQRFGFVALCGAPNAGKSTLLNRLVGKKVAAVSSKPQTTRVNLLCVKEWGPTQVAFLDSPGLFRPETPLGHILRKQSLQAFKGADVAVLVVDLSADDVEAERIFAEKVIERYIESSSQIWVALNKIDRLDSGQRLQRALLFQHLPRVHDFFLVSAATGEHVEDLKTKLVTSLPEGPWAYPPQTDVRGELTTWFSEQTREQVFEHLYEEIPYQAYVETLSLQEAEDGLHVFQNIVVAKESQKSVVIGRKGGMIRQIGQNTRHRLMRNLRRRVHLHLLVKVQTEWMSRPQSLKDAGLS